MGKEVIGNQTETENIGSGTTLSPLNHLGGAPAKGSLTFVSRKVASSEALAMRFGFGNTEITNLDNSMGVK